MSGHSKWSTIKRDKSVADSKRAALFAKLAKKIIIAVKTGKSSNLDHNFQLRVEVEKARANSMPNDNITRAITKGLGQSNELELQEIIYEAHGPAGVALIIETATDNKNRTVAKIKHILSKHNGNLGTPGSTSWQFTTLGKITINLDANQNSLVENIAIENGATDIHFMQGQLIIHCEPKNLFALTSVLKNKEVNILTSDVIKHSKQPIAPSPEDIKKILALQEELENEEDTTAVYSSLN